ncbi:MAG: hypothetical protein U0800_04950 [Isosphaeraceae bacterium]
MTVPPIRYPLPTFVALVSLILAAWWGAEGIKQIREELGRRVESIGSDQVPTQPNPMWTDSPIPRRGLLLHDDQSLLDKPDGSSAVTIGKRRIVEILNAWPLRGEPTHYLIRQDKLRGWVKADAVLLWDTRLVVRPPPQGLLVEGGMIPASYPSLPITAIDEALGTLTLAEWDPENAWELVRGFRKVKLAEVPPESLEILASPLEMKVILADPDSKPLRARAALGRLYIDASTPVSPQAGKILEPIFQRAGTPVPSARATLERIYENWRPDATWGSGEFRGIPLQLLP